MKHINRVVVSGITLILCPELAKSLGKSPALVLQQVHYWISQQNKNYGIIEEGVQWIRNSYRQWQSQIPHLSVTTIRRAFTFLEKNKIIKSKKIEENNYYPGGNQVKYFTIDYGVLETLMDNSTNTHVNKPNADCLSNNNLDFTSNKFKMNHPPDQNEHPYITEITSKKLKTLPSEEQKKQNCSKNHAKRKNLNLSNDIFFMFKTWQEVVEGLTIEEGITEQLPSKTQQIFLQKILTDYLESDVSRWQALCSKITTSKFLMGEITKFSITLGWALKFANLEKILEGTLYGFGDREGGPKKIKVLEKTQDTLENLVVSTLNDAQKDIDFNGKEDDLTLFDTLRQKFLHKQGEGMYKSWIMPGRFVKERFVKNPSCKTQGGEDKILFLVNSDFIKNTVNTKYMGLFFELGIEIMTFEAFETLSNTVSNGGKQTVANDNHHETQEENKVDENITQLFDVAHFDPSYVQYDDQQYDDHRDTCEDVSVCPDHEETQKDDGVAKNDQSLTMSFSMKVEEGAPFLKPKPLKIIKPPEEALSLISSLNLLFLKTQAADKQNPMFMKPDKIPIRRISLNGFGGWFQKNKTHTCLVEKNLRQKNFHPPPVFCAWLGLGMDGPFDWSQEKRLKGM